MFLWRGQGNGVEWGGINAIVGARRTVGRCTYNRPIVHGGEKNGVHSTQSCGVRPQVLRVPRGLRDFNPRTPCGVRHNNYNIGAVELQISIHAPTDGGNTKNAESLET